MSEDVLERARMHLDACGCSATYAKPIQGCALITDLAAEVRALRAKLDSEASHRLALCADSERFLAEVRALRAKVDVTCAYLSDRIELRWDDELIRVVVEWRDAALSARSGGGEDEVSDDEKDLIEQLNCVIDYGPLWPGDTLSNRLAQECANRGWIKRNRVGNWIVTPDGYAKSFAAAMSARSGEGGRDHG